jgi:hypothetical protein
VVLKHYSSADRGEPQREWVALRLLADHAPGLAPQPLDLTGPPWMLRMSRVSGVPSDRREALSAEHLAQLGRAFHRLWSVPVDSERALPPRIMGADATTELVSDLLGAAAVPERASCRLALETFSNWFFTTGRTQLAEPCPAPVFSRGDQNLDNVLWDRGEARLVDFEDGGLSCRSYDLADLTEHISSRGTPDAVWLEFADLHRDDCSGVFEAARRVLAGWWLLALLPGGAGHHRNPAGSDALQAERLLRLFDSA